MLSTGNKTFMNLQEAVGWLLENNALPFQSTANYVGNTEIAMSTLINPSPAKVRVGSIIFFADSKVSTVVGVTSNSFIVSDQYNDLVDDVVYVSNVAQDASGHLIVTLSNGDTIDAGLIKQISSISINASQHLIANYNDGSNVDLGALGDFSNADFVCKTLTQTQANYELTLSGLSTTFTPIYMRAQIINNVLRFIMNGYESNNSGSSVTLYTMLQANVTLPTDIASKIYDFLGKTVAESDDTVTIATGDAYISKAPYSSGLGYEQIERVLFKVYNRGTPNLVSLLIQRADGSGIVLADGEKLYITGRIELTLI